MPNDIIQGGTRETKKTLRILSLLPYTEIRNIYRQKSNVANVLTCSRLASSTDRPILVCIRDGDARRRSELKSVCANDVRVI